MFKSVFKYGILSLLFLFSTCTVDDSSDFPEITFEEAHLNEQGFQNKESYTQDNIRFINYYDDTYDYWTGFAFSQNTDMTTSGYTNQYSVYASAGADNSKTFAVGYCADYQNRYPEITDIDGTPICVSLNNTTYTYLAVRDGSAYNRAFTDGDYLLLNITGYDAAGNTTATVSFYLADFRDGRSDIVSSWTEIDLSALGYVHRIVFTMTTTDTGEYGANTPLYFSLDNLVIERK